MIVSCGLCPILVLLTCLSCHVALHLHIYIYNPDRGQGLDRRFQTRRVWPEGALAPEGQTRLVWNRRSSPARGLDCSSHMNFKPFMFLSVIYFRCPLTFPHPGLVQAFPVLAILCPILDILCDSNLWYRLFLILDVVFFPILDILYVFGASKKKSGLE